MNFESNFMMLCPMMVSVPRNFLNSGITSLSVGAVSSISSVMPVSSTIFGERSVFGWMSVLNESTILLLRTRTAPTSMISSSVGLNPVVSMSRTV